MSQDLPIPRQDNRPDGPAVVEWGGPDPAPTERVGRSLSGLARDRRLPLVPAGLGAAAAFASLVGEWMVMTVPNGGPEGSSTLRVPAGVTDIGGLGVGYLVGLLALAATLALALRGTPAVRRDARTAGLAVAVGLLGFLVATAFSLDDSGQRTFFYSPEEGFTVEYGRGLVMAFAAGALLATALHLAGRVPAGQGADGQGADGQGADGQGADGQGADGQGADGQGADGPQGAAADETAPQGAAPEAGRWGRRRAAARSDHDRDQLPAPADLTVQPTVPFARPEPPV
ncbi:hypothetical protein [Micromonospora sp. DT233]|uniref:hypothetical protein n=1 Tax=Micromonospora sp. DT233 TaxID=3393432 RepID=UPI003CF288AB